MYIAVAVASLWTIWAVVYEATGFPGLNYPAFAFVSPPLGLGLFAASSFGYSRSRTERRGTGEAVIAMFVSAGLAVVPFAALVELADYS